MPDPRLARRSLEAFSRMADAPLTDWQLAALTLETKITCVVGGRQLGKSRALAVLAAWLAFRAPRQHILVVSASEESAKRLLRLVRDVIVGSALASSLVDETTLTVTLSNESVVRAVAASERAVRGWTADALLVDEAQLLPDGLLLDAALPTVAARPWAPVVLAGSASVASGAFFDLARRGEYGDEHVRTFRWVARAAGGPDDAPWVSASLVAAARATMSDLRFSAEYLAVFAGSADQFISRQRLARAIVPYRETALGELRPAARMTVGLDWGARHDRSAAVVLGRLAVPGPPVFGVVCAHRWPAGHRMDAVAEEVASSPGHFSAVISESVGLGLPATDHVFRLLRRRADDAGGWRRRGWRIVDAQEDLVEEARRRRGRAEAGRPEMLAAAAARPRLERRFETSRVAVATSAPLKQAAYGALRMLLDRGQLLVPAGAEDLIRELLLLRVDLTLGGGERIEAPAGQHDDLPDAAMLALGPQKREGRWTTWLGRLAEQRLPELVLPPEAAGLEVVEGPDGVVVPRTPVWMSVAGRELSLPPVMPPVPPSAAQQRVWALRDRVATELARHPTTTREDP